MKQIRCIFFIVALLLGVSVSAYAQKGPPAPTEKSHRGGPPCNPGSPSDGNGNSQGIPPPVGLCLPIDDYVYLLMAVGVMYGCYKVRKFEVS